MPPKKSNLNNARSKIARRRRLERAHKSVEQRAERNAAQRIHITDIHVHGSREQCNNPLQDHLSRTRTNCILLSSKMPPKRRDIGRLSNETKRKRRKTQNETDEEKSLRKEKSRLRMSRIRATRSSQLHRYDAKIEIGHFSQDVTCINSVPVIKTEILDPSEQNQELILPDYPQHVTSIDPIGVVKTEIQDSSETNKLLIPNIKVELVESDNALDKSPRTEGFNESFINSEFENSLNSEYELTECSVLLHDCLIPKNLNSLLAKFKSLRISTDISEAFHKVNSFPLDDPFLPCISNAYKNTALSKKSNLTYEVSPNITKRKRSSKKFICSCFKTAISMGGQFYENLSESTQQLCLCYTSDNMLLESTDILVKKASLFDPNFGKITYGIKI